MKIKNFKKKLTTYMITGALTVVAIGNPIQQSYAHGFIRNSRAALAQQGKNKNAGPVQYEPQSVEGPGNFPVGGPPDGQIAGGGKFSALDEQTADRWTKVPMAGGKNTFTWTITARHKTTEWRYYITKKGWDPNDPLERSDFELIGIVNGGGKVPEATVTHTIDVPTDREGYYVILGVWEIDDTSNAFYQVMDVNLSNNGQPEPPTRPVDPPTKPEEPKPPVTPEKPDQGVKTPEGLHSMGETTSTIDLMWNVGIEDHGAKSYEIYRDGKKIATTSTPRYMDKGLQPSTTYVYRVRGIGEDGKFSNFSDDLRKTTKAAVTPPTKPVDPPTEPIQPPVKPVDPPIKPIDPPNKPIEKGSWDKNKVYVKGDQVTYDGKTYTAKWWTRGNRPDQGEVWKIAEGEVTGWNPYKAYTAGDQVSYNGITYIAKWWSRGDRPDLSQAWRQ